MFYMPGCNCCPSGSHAAAEVARDVDCETSHANAVGQRYGQQ